MNWIDYRGTLFLKIVLRTILQVDPVVKLTIEKSKKIKRSELSSALMVQTLLVEIRI